MDVDIFDLCLLRRFSGPCLQFPFVSDLWRRWDGLRLRAFTFLFFCKHFLESPTTLVDHEQQPYNKEVCIASEKGHGEYPAGADLFQKNSIATTLPVSYSAE